MRKLFLSLLAALLFQGVGFACTNLIVGKAASADGSVICTYNCDGYAWAGSLRVIPAAHHQPGEKIEVRHWWTGELRGLVDQVEYTYGVAGYINDHQVSIVETTFDGRLELEDKEGLLEYDDMMLYGLQRSATAREAILVMTGLVEKYGYASTGESITVCDKDEAWIMEIIGKGPGGKGAVWVALRIPDDCICAHANLSRIRKFPQAKKVDRKLGCYVVEEECMYSRDLISFAREKGYFSGPDADFSFRDAYCPIDFENVRYGDARVYSFFRHHTDKDAMDAYLPYINGEFDKCDALPLWIKPDTKVSVRDIMNDMRDHYEGNPLDMTADVSAGPWGMPIRPMPMTYTNPDGTRSFVERPIATQKSGFTLVSQLRGWLPDDVGGVMYYNCDDANMIAYVPIYCSVTKVPAAFDPAIAKYTDFNPECAFWMCNFVSNMVYPRYSVMIGDLREAQKELEDCYEADQAGVLSGIEGITSPEERVAYLNERSASYTSMMMERWGKLAKLLIVKHNDQIVLPSENGEVLPLKTRKYIKYPGYDEKFRRQIQEDTGDRYIMKEDIQRRER